MIIKTISRKSNVDQLIRYILADEKLEPVLRQQEQLYVQGVRLTKDDRKYLEAERNDSRLLSEMKGFEGSIKDFVKDMLNPNAKNTAKNTKEADKNKGMPPLVIKHNIRSRSVNGYIKEFAENEKLRVNTRKDSVKAFHHIISFSQLDSPQLNEKVLKDITQKFISLRGENSLYIGGVHYDSENTIHLHLVMSGTQYLTGKGNRISKEEFKELKNTLQQYQKDKYPQLVHSLPEHGKKEKGIEKGVIKNINSERSLDKDKLSFLLETAYSKATSTEHFYNLISSSGHHQVYFRNGKVQGVKYEGERKFRLSRLGYDEKKLMELNSKEKSLKELQTLRTVRTSRFKEVAIEEKDKTRSTSLAGTKAENELQNLKDIRQSRGRDMEINNSQNGMDRDIADTQNNNQGRHSDKYNDDRNYHNDKMENSDNDKDSNDENDENGET